MFYLASYQNKTKVFTKFASQEALDAFKGRFPSLMEGAHQTDLSSILDAVQAKLEAKRSFHAECNSRPMFHWVWDFKGTTYVWHKATGYDVCSREEYFAYACQWFTE